MEEIKKEIFESATYENIWENIKTSKGNFVEIPDNITKTTFFEWLIKNKPVLLHGSNNDIEYLEPRQANDTAKESGNQIAVYAVKDAILPIFYAIKDTKKFSGVAVSGKTKKDNDNTYEFAVEKNVLGNPEVFSDGIIYILDESTFIEQANNDGNPSGEYTSKEKVKPLAKIRVSKNDFPYLSEIKIWNPENQSIE